jgi:hypothetical protein
MLVIVHVRRPGAPDEWPNDQAKPSTGPVTLPRSYRVPTAVVAAKYTVVALFVLAALVVPGRPATALAGLAALAVAVYATRDLLARERLRIDRDGLTVVHGFAGHGQLRWDQIERIRVDERLRLGIRTQLLEVDAGDWIGLYGRSELGADPSAVLSAIDAARAG